MASFFHWGALPSECTEYTFQMSNITFNVGATSYISRTISCSIVVTQVITRGTNIFDDVDLLQM